MDSADREITAEIDGRVYVLQQSGQSYQPEVLKRLDGIEQRLGGLEARAGALENGQALILGRIDTLATAVYWVLGAIGIFLAALGIFTGIYLWIASDRKEKREVRPDSSLTPSEVIRIVKEITGSQPFTAGK
ncbi:MAG: hypothetical protein IJR85_04815 [Synergistaceae bacterium]|nr:hypothetical protein [Synergistaceae bacterium]